MTYYKQAYQEALERAERAEAEVERLRAAGVDVDMVILDLDAQRQRAERAEAEALFNKKVVLEQQERAEKAEAEVERLREHLQTATDSKFIDKRHYDAERALADDLGEALLIARRHCDRMQVIEDALAKLGARRV